MRNKLVRGKAKAKVKTKSIAQSAVQHGTLLVKQIDKKTGISKIIKVPAQMGKKFVNKTGIVKKDKHKVKAQRKTKKKAAKNTNNGPDILNRGSTGRTNPNNLQEKLAMKEVKSNPLNGAQELTRIKMTDPRWLGKDAKTCVR